MKRTKIILTILFLMLIVIGCTNDNKTKDSLIAVKDNATTTQEPVTTTTEEITTTQENITTAQEITTTTEENITTEHAHSYTTDWTIVEPTDTTNGYRYKKCDDCDDIYIDPDFVVDSLSYIDGLVFEPSENESYYIVSGKENYEYKVVVIPASYNNKLVKEIKYNAFRGNKNIASVVIPNSVTTIGNSAFYNCISLTSIIISESVTSIGNGSFFGCSSLNNLYIPKNVSSIANNSFKGCCNLNSIIVDDANEYYNSNNDCNCLIETSSKTIIIGTNNSTINSDIRIINDYAFYNCSLLKNIVLPETLTSIGECAFYNCSSIEEIVFPNSLLFVGKNAFNNCSSLNSVVLSKNVNYDNMSYNSMFKSCPLLKTAGPKEGNYNVRFDWEDSIPPFAFINCDYLNSITIPDGFKTISALAFLGCSSLKSITLPNSITSIGNGAFSECSLLTSFTIPNNVNEIGNGIFTDCLNLVEIYNLSSVELTKKIISNSSMNHNVIIHSSLEEESAIINYNNLLFVKYENEYSLFDYIGSEESIVLPDKIEGKTYTLAKHCFDGKAIKSITIPETITAISKHSFSFCKNLETVVLPSTLKSIDDEAFSFCISLKTIELPSELTSIGYCAFMGSGLKTIAIPDSVTDIGVDAFGGCLALESATISNAIIVINDGVFNNCTSLKSITISNNVTTIKNGAFDRCESLESISIPKSIVKIESNAFAHCSSLNNITFNGTKQEWMAISRDLDYNPKGGLGDLKEEYDALKGMTIHCLDGDLIV